MLPQELQAYVEQSLQALVKEQQELSPPFVTELHDCLPSSVEFARFVHANRPVVIRRGGFLDGLPALQKWNAPDEAYLLDRLGDRELTIAVTPNGNADAIVDGKLTEPAEEKMTLRDFLDEMRQPRAGRVLYEQSQAGNLTSELACLADDVGLEGPSFATEALGAMPDVANVWMGDSRSITSLHKDPYENVYCVVRGSKTFTLYPPYEVYCLYERRYPLARYSYDKPNGCFSQEVDASQQQVPWVSIDPLRSEEDLCAEFPRYRHARPLTVTVHAGDYFYLPALWYHHVQQAGNQDQAQGLVLAVNWWYDQDYSAPLWSSYQFVRRMSLALDGQQEEVDSTNA